MLNERIASATEIAKELGADVDSFYHHVEELEKLGFIERVRVEQRRGWREHFFPAKRMVFFDDEAWRRMPESLRADLAAGNLQFLFDESWAPSRAGTSMRATTGT